MNPVRPVGAVILAVACLLLGAAAQRIYDARHRAEPIPLAPHGASSQATSTESALQSATSITVPASPAPPPVPFTSIHFDQEPLWAYGVERPPRPDERAAPQAPPGPSPAPGWGDTEQTRPRHVPGSRAAFSLAQIADAQNVVDWFPDDHPPMPAVIAHGPVQLGRMRRGCAICHLPNGQGRPENAQPAGLPASYIVRQIEDFRRGLRYSADARKDNTNTMIDLARAMTDEELRAAAEYYSSIQFKPWVRVIETDRVPRTRIDYNLFLPVEQARTEPIAGRIVEVPENQQQSEILSNPHSGFIAYVPPGSLARGKDLVTTGGMRISGDRILPGRTLACVSCHGPDLLGIGDVPPLAGRSPSYIARQLWDMQQGTRRGMSSQLMKMVVGNLSPSDLVDIAAYLASLPPLARPPP